MKVLHVIHNYAPSVGGSQLLFQQIGEGITARYGDDVTVLTTNAMRSPSFLDNQWLPAGDEDVRGVHVRRLPFVRRPLPWMKRALTLSRKLELPGREWLEPLLMGPISPAMLRAVRASDADVIGCMAFPFLHMYLPFVLGRRRPRLVLFGALHLHGDHVPAPIVAAARRADAYVAFTDFEADALARHGVPRERLHVVGLGVDVARFAAARGDELRARHGLDGPVVGFIGRQAPHKGCDVLVRAMADVWEQHPTAMLLLAGARTAFSTTLDAMIAALPEARRARVVRVDDFREADKPAWFAACDVFASVSTEESFGISFVEAWAAHRPVIGGRIPAVEQVIRHELDGLLVPCRDPGALAGAINRLLEDPSLRERYARAGHDKVRARHDWPGIVDRIRRIYQGKALRS